MTFKSGAAFLSILTLSFLIRSISCDTEESFFKRLLKVRCKDDNHEVAHKPIYVKGRQEEKKAKQDDDYTLNNSEFYSELRSDLRTNLKNLFKYESTKKEHKNSATQRKEEETWKDKGMLRSEIRRRPKYDLKSLLSKDDKRTEMRQITYPQKLGHKELEMENLIEPGKNDYKIVEAGRIRQPLENGYETVEMGQIAEPEENHYEPVEIGQIAEPDENDYEIIEIGQIAEPEEEKVAEKVAEKKAEKVAERRAEKEEEKAETRAQLLNPFKFENIIAKEWKQLDDIDNRAWADIANSCQIALTYGLHSDPNRYSKMDKWKNQHKTFCHMRYIKNRTDKRRLDDFMSRLRTLKGGKRYEELWKAESEKWEVIKYLKKSSDENWNKNLKQSWARWFRTEIPEANFDAFI